MQLKKKEKNKVQVQYFCCFFDCFFMGVSAFDFQCSFLALNYGINIINPI